MANKKRDVSAENLARLYGQQYTYGFGGGTIGGDIWNFRQPSYMERLAGKNELVPELKPEFRGMVNVMPSGRGSSQELRGMREAGGRPYVETPELYRRGKGTSQQDRDDQFYSTVSGRSMGTLMGTGDYGGHSAHGRAGYVETKDGPVKVGQKRGGYSKKRESDEMQAVDSVGQGRAAAGSSPIPKPKILPMPTGSYMSDQYGYGFTSQPLGFSGEPAAFTLAGSRIGMRPSPTSTATPPPFPEFDSRNYLMGSGFGGIPRFPYSNY